MPAAVLSGPRTATFVPVVPERDAARAAARRELADPAYSAHEPSLWQRAASWVIDQVKNALDGAQAPGGPWAVIAFGGVIVLLALLVRARLGPMAATNRRRGTGLFTEESRTAADHHRSADAALAAGDFDTALQERFRALVRGLEERGLVQARPGYTADEAAGEAARILPECAAQLRAAARAFDDVRYGDRSATAVSHGVVAGADAAARSARPVLSAAAAHEPGRR